MPVDDPHLAIPRGVDDDRRLSAETEVRDFDNYRGKDRRDPGIDRIAARGEQSGPRVYGERASGRHHAVRRADLRADGASRGGLVSGERRAAERERRRRSQARLNDHS